LWIWKYFVMVLFLILVFHPIGSLRMACTRYKGKVLTYCKVKLLL
jgi:hypothetical protein